GDAAAHLEALRNPTRLKIYGLRVRPGVEWLSVGYLQAKLDFAPSTLSHHLKALVLVGLVTQGRQSTTLICRANYDVMHRLIDLLVAECCVASACPPDQHPKRRARSASIV